MKSERVLLADLTTMRLGGPAELRTLETVDEIIAAVDAPHRWLGRGANLLVADRGVDEPVLRLGEPFKELAFELRADGSARVRAGGAVDLAVLVARCAERGLKGPEGLAGVPATIGGALRMNAGTSTCWLSDWVARVQVLLPGDSRPSVVERAAIPASYRQCGLPAGTVFLGCELELAPGDPVHLKSEAARLRKAKAATQPLALPSAGCVFRNPRPDLPAGKLIDQLGLKGLRIGGCTVSTVHANFIVNDHGGSSADVCALVERIRETARREAGVELHMEVEAWNCFGQDNAASAAWRTAC